jgi:hypothetical protein
MRSAPPLGFNSHSEWQLWQDVSPNPPVCAGNGFAGYPVGMDADIAGSNPLNIAAKRTQKTRIPEMRRFMLKETGFGTKT